MKFKIQMSPVVAFSFDWVSFQLYQREKDVFTRFTGGQVQRAIKLIVIKFYIKSLLIKNKR